MRKYIIGWLEVPELQYDNIPTANGFNVKS